MAAHGSAWPNAASVPAASGMPASRKAVAAIQPRTVLDGDVQQISVAAFGDEVRLGHDDQP
jgi:hypothetical protein